MAQILLIDDDLNLLQMVRLMLQRLGHQVITSRDGEQGLRLAAEVQPDLAIIDIMMPGLSGYDVVHELRRNPRTARMPIIILTARSQPMDKHQALRAGANAFIAKPVTAQELADRVEAVLEAGVGFRITTGLLAEPVESDLGPPPPGTPDYGVPRRGTTPLGTPQPEPPRASRPLDPLPLTAVVGMRGGTGSTTVAVNLACWLALRGEDTVLLDLSTDSGHVPLHLHLAPPHNWGSLLHHRELPDAAAVRDLIALHKPTGLRLVAAPAIPPGEPLSGPATEALLHRLSANAARLVVDIPHLDTAGAMALRLASSILLVLTDDAASVHTALQALAAFERMGIDPRRTKIVLNHVHRMRDIPVETMQKVLKQTLAAEIPFEAEQLNAIRRGTPLVVALPESAFTHAIEQVARQAGL
jgi:CheY-like chemotaxis protein